MERIKSASLHFWKFNQLSRETGIRHFVTDRDSGGNGVPFTLSYSSHPDRTFVQENRNMVSEAMQLHPDRLYLPSQVHGTAIKTVHHQTRKDELLQTDALVSNERGVCIAVMSADCVPILLYDKQNGVVAAVHSGWRGTVALILDKTLRKMNKDYGTKGVHLLAGIGPSVSQESYEVGEEVIMHVRSTFGSSNLLQGDNKKARLDLWEANKIQLLDFGVPPGNIEISNLCTVKNNDHFFSARKGDSGRFAAGIMLI